MEVISHRGIWHTAHEHNTQTAFARSFDAGIGTETDLRDHNGEIVVAHDMPTGSPLLFETLLQQMAGRNLTLALNIKADGMAYKINQLLAKYQHTNYFVFDMSVPDMAKQLVAKNTVFTGLSDIQPHPVLLDKSAGVWLDCFLSDWYDATQIDALLNQGKKVCIVSADLHKRSTDAQWRTIKQARGLHSDNLLLCTDKPHEARQFFAL
jgi:hypothetical protein